MLVVLGLLEGVKSAAYGLGTGSGTVKGGKGISIRGESRGWSLAKLGVQKASLYPCRVRRLREAFQGMFAQAWY